MHFCIGSDFGVTGEDVRVGNCKYLLNQQTLIIEVHGKQHYEITGFTQLTAKHYNTTPEYELKYQKWKDKYKKEYALKNGYYFLEIPYWTEIDNTYQSLIDSKIKKILKEAV